MRPVTGAEGDRDSLARLLGGPEMTWLVRRVRDRALTAEDEVLTGVVRLDAPTAAQRDGAVKLVGRPTRTGAALRLDLADIEVVLRRGPWPAGLVDAVVTLTGPLVDLKAERESATAAWAQARAVLAGPADRFPGLGGWWDAWCLAGGLKRAARGEATRLGLAPGPDVATHLVGELARVLEALPAAGVPIAVFARQVVGDAHGLDESRPLGRVARTVIGAAFAAGDAAGLSRRDTWARAGVVMSNVSSTVLALGLPGSLGSDLGPLGAATASALEAMRAARAPVVLTLDQVRSGGVAALPRDGVVHVCENPTVVEVVAGRWAALRSDRAPHPVLVCSSGQPSTAVIDLLETLLADGAECRYHGDFDWSGLRIAAVVRARVPWNPWRFSPADYLAATDHETSTLGLVGGPVDAPWDPDLTSAMVRVGRAVEEEAVAELLAADLLERPSPPSARGASPSPETTSPAHPTPGTTMAS